MRSAYRKDHGILGPAIGHPRFMGNPDSSLRLALNGGNQLRLLAGGVQSSAQRNDAQASFQPLTLEASLNPGVSSNQGPLTTH